MEIIQGALFGGHIAMLIFAWIKRDPTPAAIAIASVSYHWGISPF